MTTDTEITAALYELETTLPALVSTHGAQKALSIVSSRASCLVRRASPEQEALIFQKVGCLLSSAGLGSGQDEGEQCPLGEAPPGGVA